MPKAPSSTKPASTSSPSKTKPSSTRSTRSNDGVAVKATKPASKKAAKPVITKETFLAAAKPFELQLHSKGGTKSMLEMEVAPKEMSTGSFGWSGTKHATLPLEGQEDVHVIVTVNVTLKGSKGKGDTIEEE